MLTHVISLHFSLISCIISTFSSFRPFSDSLGPAPCLRKAQAPFRAICDFWPGNFSTTFNCYTSCTVQQQGQTNSVPSPGCKNFLLWRAFQGSWENGSAVDVDDPGFVPSTHHTQFYTSLSLNDTFFMILQLENSPLYPTLFFFSLHLLKTVSKGMSVIYF